MQPHRPLNNKPRSRRLRKKLRIGEFREDGFEVEFKFAQLMTNDEKVDFLFKFIEEVIEARDLSFGGGESGYVTRSGRGSATDADRVQVLTTGSLPYSVKIRYELVREDGNWYVDKAFWENGKIFPGFEQISMPTIKIFQHFRQMMCGDARLKTKHPVDNMIGSRFIGRV